LIEGSGKVAERLFRDLLLAVARARPVSERIATLKQAYRLEQLVALPDRGLHAGEDDEELAARVRELRELTAQQKDTWLKYTSGNRAALEPFSKQAVALAERAGRLPPVDAIEGGLLDEMTRRAQEKLLIFQVGQEVQVNLQNIEQALDGFFRDPAKRGDLAALPPLFAQVQGALMIMELHDAASLN